MSEPEEQWRAVSGFEGFYEVSSFGKLRGLDRLVGYRYSGMQRLWKGRIRKASRQKTGYMLVELRNNGTKTIAKLVHRLVAQAFVPNPENKPHVNHLDGNKANNHVDNLAWCTAAENERHSYVTLGKKANLTGLGRKGALHAQSKPVFQFSLKGEFIAKHGGATEAARSLYDKGFPKASQNRVSCCARNETAYAYGFIWLYNESDLDAHLSRLPRLRQWLLRDRRRNFGKKAAA